MASSELLTLAEAADTLKVTPQWISQLLAAGELDGPSLPPGRLRFPPNSGRVYRSSLDTLLRDRAKQTSALRATESGVGRESSSSGPSAPSPDADRARAAAQELKVKLDVMRDQLRAERKRSRQLMGIAAQLLEMLQVQGDGADALDDVSDGYSSALTQLLGPHALS